ncbi:MAG TPA: peptidylprolyl isomerase [Blastocatellia bacterium]|nr:peptidylprolyl isomerase [Blastocatellia bacterium]
MNRFTAFLLIVCAMAAANAAGCRSDAGSPVIATVNGREIHRDAFERFLALKMGEFSSAGVPDSLRSEMLDEYIRRQLVLDEAERAGLEVTDSEIEQAAKENPHMRSTAATARTREELAADLLIEKYYRQIVLRDLRTSQEEIQEYIAENQARLADHAAFYVREIRVQSREQAEALRREVTEGGRDFAEVARLHSDAPGSEQGGLSRYEEGQLPAMLEKVISPLRPGDVSQVVASSFGFHIFKLERRLQTVADDERRSQLAERRSQLAEELIARKNQQAVDEAINRLISSATIKIYDPALGFTYAGRLRQN